MVLRATSEVETLRENPYDYLVTPSNQRLPVGYQAWEVAQLGPALKRAVVPIHVDPARELAEQLRADRRGEVVPFLARLTETIHRRFKVVHRAKGSPWPPATTIEQRQGACRDLAVLWIDVCRSVGLAARFVSGYQEGDDEQGTKDLHAWAEVYIPGAGWRGFDPTNGLAVTDRHVTVDLGVHPVEDLVAGPLVGHPQTLAVDGDAPGHHHLEVGLARGVRRGHHQADPLSHAHCGLPRGRVTDAAEGQCSARGCPGTDHTRWPPREVSPPVSGARSLTAVGRRGRMARGQRTLFRVGVDIGGTFTDIVFLDASGRLHTKKVSSSVDDYARAIVDGLREVFRDTGVTGADIVEVLHGTTVASNAVLELKGARTGLITTKGFRDVLEIRRLRMPRLYDLTWEKPPPLVERALRQEVTERIDAQGAGRRRHSTPPRSSRPSPGSAAKASRRSPSA